VRRSSCKVAVLINAPRNFAKYFWEHTQLSNFAQILTIEAELFHVRRWADTQSLFIILRRRLNYCLCRLHVFLCRLCCSVYCSCVIVCCAELCCTVLYCTVLYCAVLCCCHWVSTLFQLRNISNIGSHTRAVVLSVVP